MRAGLLLGISVLWIPLAFLFDGVTVLMLPIRLSGGATDLGIVSFIGLGVAAVLQPIVGALSDRLRDRVDRRTIAALAAVPAIAGVWLLVGSTGAIAALVAYVIIQAAATSIQASQQTLIPEHVGRDGQGRASGLKAAFDVGGAFVAFLLLGAALAGGELLGAAAVTTAVLVAALVLMVLLVPSRAWADAGADAAESRPVGGAPESPGLLAPLVVSRFLFLLATYAVGRFLLLLVAERLGIPSDRAADEAGGLLALLTLTTAGAAIPFGWLADRISRRDLMVAGSLIAAAGIVLLAPAAGMPGLITGGLLMAIGTAAFVTANWAATTAVVPAGDAGRLMGVANLGTALAAAVAGLVGPVIDLAGFAPALLVAAVVSAAAAIPLMTTSPSTRSVESPT
ncbi:MAG: MFS transporter [Chloroflexota bacterium]